MSIRTALVSFAVCLATYAMAESFAWKPFDPDVYGEASISGDSATKITEIKADRFSGGQGALAGAPLAGAPSEFYSMSDDFLNPDGLAPTTLNGWSILTNALAGGLSISGIGGQLSVNCSTSTVNLGVSAVFADDPSIPTWKIVQGTNQFWFECRVKATDTNAANAMFVGLALTNTTYTALADNTGVLPTNSSFVGFWTKGGATAPYWQAVYKKSSSSAVTYANSTLTASDKDWVTLGFAFNGYSNLTFYADGVAKTGSVTWTGSTVPNDLFLAPIVVSKGLTNLPAGTVEVTVLDYIKIISER